MLHLVRLSNCSDTNPPLSALQNLQPWLKRHLLSPNKSWAGMLLKAVKLSSTMGFHRALNTVFMMSAPNGKLNLSWILSMTLQLGQRYRNHTIADCKWQIRTCVKNLTGHCELATDYPHWKDLTAWIWITLSVCRYLTVNFVTPAWRRATCLLWLSKMICFFLQFLLLEFRYVRQHKQDGLVWAILAHLYELFTRALV